MPLTQKQASQVAKAPEARKPALRATFAAQNTRNQSGAPAAPPKRATTARGPWAEARRELASKAKPMQPAMVPNYLDPMHPQPMPSVTSDGKALPHTGLVSSDFQVGTTNSTVLIVTNTGNSGTVGAYFQVTPAGALVGDATVLTIPTLAAADTAGGASASRAMKFGVSVVNCTNALKRGGRVTYINSSQRLPPRSCSPADDYLGIINGIKASPYRRRVNGDDLMHPKQLIGYPVDNVAYTTFTAHHGSLTTNEFFSYVLGASACDTPQTRAMSVVAFIFDPVADVQDYSVTIRASYYTRWPLTSVPGQSMSNIPTATAAVINHTRDKAENAANDLVHIIEGGAAATVAPKAAAAVRGAGQSLMGRLGGALRGGAAAAEEMAEGYAADIIGAAGAEGLAAAAPLLLL